MKFAHLHAHTTFSFLDGYGTPEQIGDRILELGQTAVAVTDHGSLIGHVPCEKAYKDRGIKTIFGCEFYITESIEARNNHQSVLGMDCLPHITILAKDQQGYSNLLKMSRISYENGFYVKPRIDHRVLFAHQQGLIVLSGCPTGFPARIAAVHGYEYLKSWFQWMKNNVENYYVEIVPQFDFEPSIKAVPMMWNAARELGIPLVVTCDAHFPKPSDYICQDALLAVGTKSRIDQGQRKIKLPEYQYYCRGEEAFSRTQAIMENENPMIIAEAVERSHFIAESCNVELKKTKTVSFPGVPDNMTPKDLLWQWVCEGMKTRYAQGKIDAPKWSEYGSRAQHELVTLDSKGFCDYMLAIIDVITWMKKNENLVVTRGSAGGSLILWLTGASETDPIKHGLSFERFYDSTRPDPPDVDIDFEQLKRDEAIEYIYEKYGRENCSKIAALSKIGPRASIQDACASIGVPRSEFSRLSESIDDKNFDMVSQLNSVSDSKAREVLEKYPLLKTLIPGMCGQYRHSSIHAAGVLVASQPLNEVIGVIVSPNGVSVSAVDKEGASYLGFLKIDMLSVSALDVIAEAARKSRGFVSWLYDVPLDDPSCLVLAKNQLNAGVFQLDGPAAGRALREIGADSFDDLVAASVLCRPGATEFIPVYKRNKYIPDEFHKYLSNMHPIAASIVAPTFGVLMYQEQVMAMARQMAGLEWKDVHKLRKDVGKKMGLDPINGDKWRAEWLEKFVSGCLKNGVSPEEAQRWWYAIEHHGGYSFNKSHGVTYGYVGYWMLYMKAHFTARFYEAFLKIEQEPVLKKRLIREFIGLGGKIKLLDWRLSREDFTAIDDTLVGGFKDLTYVGQKTAEKICSKEFKSFDDMMSALPKRTKELVIKSGVLSGGKVDVSVLIKLAPWMPITEMDPRDIAFRSSMAMGDLRSLHPGSESRGNIGVSGYVTDTDFSAAKLRFTIEDHTNVVSCRVKTSLIKSHVGESIKKIKAGDFIYVKGWWSGDVLFVSEFTIVRDSNA